MGSLGCLSKSCAALFALVSILAGLLASGKLTQWGLFVLIAEAQLELGSPVLIGMVPAAVRATELESAFAIQDVKPGDLLGRTAVVTGANSGVGFMTALHLARCGANTIMACRSERKCRRAAGLIQKSLAALRESGQQVGKTVPVTMDVSSLASVREFAEAFSKVAKAVDILVLNAGITPSSVRGGTQVVLTEDGVETVFATNHLGHFLLTRTLMPALRRSAATSGDTRIVVVSSASHYMSPSDTEAALESRDSLNDPAHYRERYALTKLVNVLFAQELARRLGDASGFFVNALHPGMVETSIWDDQVTKWRAALERSTFLAPLAEPLLAAFASMRQQFMWSTQEGTRTQFYLAASPLVRERRQHGLYFHPVARQVQASHEAQGERGASLAAKVWALSEQLVGPNEGAWLA